MTGRYILDGHNAVAEDDLMTWAKWFERADRVVAKTKTPNGEVSTVFLGLDHQFGDGPPLLFETLIFGGSHNQQMWRCTTWEQAEDQHQAAIEFTTT